MKTTKKRPIWRDNEFPPNCRSTDDIYMFLRRTGGVNPFGENNYLAVIASEVRCLYGDEFPEYTESAEPGKLEFDEETTLVRVPTKVPGSRAHVETILAEVPAGMHVKDKPLRTVKEMRWVQRWPDKEGWALLHWEPNAGGCSRQWWEQWIVPGTSLQRLGPWPEHGMYWFFCEGFDPVKKDVTLPTFSEMPPLSWMERAIAQFEHNRSSPDAKYRMLAALAELRDRREKIRKQAREDTVKKFGEISKTVLSSSLEAARFRNSLAKQLEERSGVKLGHVGA